MKVVSIPTQLRLGALFLALVLPTIALEVMIGSQARWSKPPLDLLFTWCGLAALVLIPVIYSVLLIKRWALSFLRAGLSLWCILSLSASFELHSPTLGFFTVFTLFGCLALYLWISFELHRSYLDPGLKWYHSLPKPISGLEVKVALEPGGEATAGRFKVSRFDTDGAFVFAEKAGLLRLPHSKSAGLTLTYRDREVRCRGAIIVELEAETGLGLQFRGMNADARKELSDFVESLRGEGHVN